MAISSLRSRRARRDSAGFTLLEVMCAIIVMNVLVMVTARQIMAHNALVQTLEEWCENDPIYYVDPAADPIYRAAEVPSELREAPAPTAKVSTLVEYVEQVLTGYDVEVQTISRDLESLTTKAYVVQSGLLRLP
jgi:prepilin-type N-terminal cleavage/methylation domain-containing protein